MRFCVIRVRSFKYANDVLSFMLLNSILYSYYVFYVSTSLTACVMCGGIAQWYSTTGYYGVIDNKKICKSLLISYADTFFFVMKAEMSWNNIISYVPDSKCLSWIGSLAFLDSLVSTIPIRLLWCVHIVIIKNCYRIIKMLRHSKTVDW